MIIICTKSEIALFSGIEAELGDACDHIEVARGVCSFLIRYDGELLEDPHVALRFRHTGEGARDDDLVCFIVQVLGLLDLRDDVIRLGLDDRE